MELETLPATAFKSPAIALSGVVDYEMYTKFRTQFDAASEQSIVVIELSTLGGDPEVARMMGEDVRFASEMGAGAALCFSWEGSDLFSRHYLYELFRAPKPIPRTRNAANDPRAKAVKEARDRRPSDDLHRGSQGDFE